MTAITILIMLALAATIVSLVLGIGSMAKGGEFDEKHSVQFMNARVISQGAALVLLVIALVIAWSD